MQNLAWYSSLDLMTGWWVNEEGEVGRSRFVNDLGKRECFREFDWR